MYLYIQSDGTLKQSVHAPDDADQQSILDGDLLVVEFRPLESTYMVAQVDVDQSEEEEEEGIDPTYTLGWEKVETA